MYAVIKTGGKQYKVEEGTVLQVEKLEQNEGGSVEFNDVLMYSDGDNIILGNPIIEKAVVKAQVVKQAKDKKVIVFKYKRRKGYRRKRGHRQNFTEIKIDSITT